MELKLVVGGEGLSDSGGEESDRKGLFRLDEKPIDDEEAAVRMASRALYSDIHALMKQLFAEELTGYVKRGPGAGTIDLAKEAIYRQLRLSEAIFVGGVISFLDIITSKFTDQEMHYVEWARDEIGRLAQKRGHQRLFLKKRR